MGNQTNYVGKLYEIEYNEFREFATLIFDVFFGSVEEILKYKEDEKDILKYETGYVSVKYLEIGKLYAKMKSKGIDLAEKEDCWFQMSCMSGSDNIGGNYVLSNFYTFELLSEIKLSLDIDSVEIIGEEDARDLSELVDLKSLWEEGAIEEIMKEIEDKISENCPEGCSKINVISFNVGQGNATGVFYKTTPLFYFDLGGSLFGENNCCARNENLSANDDTFIIISHWHLDHYKFLITNKEKYEKCKVIAPLQSSSPNIIKMAKKLGKNLYLVDKEFDKVTEISFFKIFKCKGKSINDSGLALFIDLEKFNDISKILLPGDAQYTYIDPKLKEDLDALCVSHHGGKIIKNEDFPTPTENICYSVYSYENKELNIAKDEKNIGYCVYSYGKGNHYGHPLKDTESIHEKKRWGKVFSLESKSRRLDTTGVDIIYSFNHKKVEGFEECQYFHNLFWERIAKLLHILREL